jgi:hypothetical protein
LACPLIAALACVALAAGAPRPGAAPDQLPAATPVLAPVRASVATATLPVVVGAREVVQDVLDVPRPPPVGIAPAAVELIIRWEVSGEAQYLRRLRSPIWPGGASGITWGIGYDGGHTTAPNIRADWAAHAEAERLAGAAGIAGTKARDALSRFADIDVPWPLARGVFADRSLPAYRRRARSAFGHEDFDALPAPAQGALVSLVYNRGASMVGGRNTEKRAIRDQCVPAGDVHCVAAQLRAMCRLWAGTPNGVGLCRRRNDEARLAEGGA